jgi:8-oxo-dGTP pyrophosphatase MutT (NUDIX family)
MNDIESIDHFDLRLADASWAFAKSEEARIAEHWQHLAAMNPRLWNGEVLMCHHAEIADGAFTGRFFRTDYASFVAWRDWGHPDPMVLNCFGSAVVRSREGALLYGRMAGHTLNAGMVYPPGGSLEPHDLRADGTIDVMGSIIRELKEETGLDAAEASDGGLLLVCDGPRISIAQILDYDRTAGDLAGEIGVYLASQQEDELAGVEIIASDAQIDARMPGFAARIARHLLARRGTPKV